MIECTAHRYPDLKYTIHRFDLNLTETHYYAHLRLMGCDMSDRTTL